MNVIIESQITGHIGHFYTYIKSVLSVIQCAVIYVPSTCAIEDKLFRKVLVPYEPPQAKRSIVYAKLVSALYQLRMSITRYREVKRIIGSLDPQQNHLVIWTTMDDFELVSFLMLRVPPNVSLFGIAHLKIVSLYTKLALIGMRYLHLLRSSHKTLGCNTPEIIDQIDGLAGKKVCKVVAPYPFQRPEPTSACGGERRFISYLGDARTEKGIDLLLDCVTDLAARSEVFIQCYTSPRLANSPDEAVVSKLNITRQRTQHDERIHWKGRNLSDEEYQSIISSSKLLLLPYRPDRYAGRISGILGEALISGVPVVVSPGSWLAEQVKLFGGGVIMQEYSAQGLLEAVDTLLQDIEHYSQTAITAGEEFYKVYSKQRLREVIESCSKAHISAEL